MAEAGITPERFKEMMDYLEADLKAMREHAIARDT
jgi:hypothetical protein